MTEQQLQHIIWEKLCKSLRLVVPNWSPEDWFECDVWGVTNAGMAWEFEIKVTRSDFRKDASKAPGSLFTGGHRVLRTTQDCKYSRLASGDYRGPNNFVYVAPRGIIPREEVPVWAGLWEFVPGEGLEKVLKAQRLHKSPVSEREVERARTAIYYRYWNAKQYGQRSQIQSAVG